jgi:hypothetical protein
MILTPPDFQFEFSRIIANLEKPSFTQQTYLLALNKPISFLQHRAFRGEL